MNNPNNNPTDNTDAYDAQGSWGAFADYLAQEVADFVRERDSDLRRQQALADWEARNERDRLDKENN